MSAPTVPPSAPLSMSLPELVVTPTTTQLFMFSAATWNRHRIHFDHAAAVGEGHPGVVVQRGLLGNFLARLVTSWLQGRGALTALSWKVLKSAVAGAPLRCRGEVTAQERHGAALHLLCELRVIDASDATIATGQAWVELPGSREAPAP